LECIKPRKVPPNQMGPVSLEKALPNPNLGNFRPVRNLEIKPPVKIAESSKGVK